MERAVPTSPQWYARACGLLYLYVIVAGTTAEVLVRSRLIVSGDAAATAANIRAHELAFRLGFTAELVHCTFDVAIAVLLYVLLRSVSRTVALMAAFMRLATDVVLAVSSLSHFAALRLVGPSPAFDAFTRDQRDALALLALRLHADGYAICLLFFAFACLTLGYLVHRSGFLPRWLGVLLGLAGTCYLVQSLAYGTAPTVADRLFPGIYLPVFVAEAALTAWLLVRGVDRQRWEQSVAVSARQPL